MDTGGLPKVSPGRPNEGDGVPLLKLCRVRGGSTGAECESLGATIGGGNNVAGWITAPAAGWMTMFSGRPKLGGSITPPSAGLPKIAGTVIALPTGGGTGGGGYTD